MGDGGMRSLARERALSGGNSAAASTSSNYFTTSPPRDRAVPASRAAAEDSVSGSVQGAIAEVTERRLASAQADTFENHQRSRASLAMASGAISEQQEEQGEFLMASGAISEQQVGVRTSLRRPPALKIKIQRKVAQHGGIGKTESGSGSGSGIEAGAEAE